MILSNIYIYTYVLTIHHFPIIRNLHGVQSPYNQITTSWQQSSRKNGLASPLTLGLVKKKDVGCNSIILPTPYNSCFLALNKGSRSSLSQYHTQLGNTKCLQVGRWCFQAAHSRAIQQDPSLQNTQTPLETFLLEADLSAMLAHHGYQIFKKNGSHDRQISREGPLD